MEVSNGPLPFQDVSILIGNQAFVTEVYRKPTNTGVTMNFNCTAPMKWKRALIYCLQRRAHQTSSSFTTFLMEVDKITTILKNNAYPKYVVNRALKDFTTKHQICEDNYCASKRNKPMATEIQDQTQAYLAVPYLGKPSLKFQSRIRKEMEKYGLNLISSYTTTKTSSYFSLKSNPPILFRSNIVYRFNCSCDKNVTYVGETRRHLFRRIIDHTGKR